jgi:protein CMS1
MTDDVKTQPLLPLDGSTPVTAAQNKRKRKREKEKANKQLSETAKVPKLDNDHERKPKPFKQPEPKKPAKPEKINDSIAQMDPNLTADYINRRLRKFEKDLSAVELEDRFIPTRAFLDTTSYSNNRTLENLSEFLETCNCALNPRERA